MQSTGVADVLDLMRSAWQQAGPAAATVARILLIVALAWLLVVALQRAIRAFRLRIAARLDDRESIKRAETLGRVFRYLVAVVVSLLAGMLVMAELGVSVAPILGAAGVVGVAVGFGAQSLVRDYFNGFFLLVENQIRQGDVVQLGNHAGLVEEITLRYVRLRDYDGHVHVVPNGHISTVVNFSRDHAQSVMDVAVGFGQDVDAMMDLMHQVGRDMRSDPGFASRLLDDLEMAGVERWTETSLVLRCRFKCQPLEQWNVRREFLRRLKRRFDEQGVPLAVPQLQLRLPDGVRWPEDVGARSLSAAGPPVG